MKVLRLLGQIDEVLVQKYYGKVSLDELKRVLDVRMKMVKKDSRKRGLKSLTDKISYLPHHAETDRPVPAAICGDRHTMVVGAGNSRQHAQLLRLICNVAEKRPADADTIAEGVDLR